MREKFPLHRAGERVKGAILFRKREWPLWNPKRKTLIGRLRLEWPLCLRKVTACAALPRLELLYDLPLLLLSAVAQPLAALLPYGCGTPLAGAALLIL